MKRGRPKTDPDQFILLLQKKSLLKYKDVIWTYKNSFIDYLQYEEEPNKYMVQSIKAFNQLDEWKQNWWILYIYYKRDFYKTMQTEMQISRQDLMPVIFRIKKEIKTNIKNQ